MIERKETRQNLETYFDFRVRETVGQLSNRIEAYAEVLRSTGGLFRASEQVTRQEFHDFITSLGLADYYPGVQGVGYAALIAPESLDAHTQSIRQEGFPTYSVNPEGPRDVYSSVLYLEPFSERNLRAFGYDMYSESVRRQAMDKALENNSLSLSGAVRLVQESGHDEQAGFLMYLPVYAHDMPISTPAQRRQNIVGWAYSVFRMNDFMQNVQEEFARDLEVEIFDGEDPAPDALIYDSNALALDERQTDLTQTFRFMAVDHPWTITISALPSIDQRVDVNNAAYVISIGVLTSVFLSMIVWLLLTGRQRAIMLSREVHKELIYEQERLNNIIAGTRIGTWEWNVQTGETTFNEYWAAIVGYTLTELAPISIDTWSRLVHPDDLSLSESLLEKHFSGELPYYECEVRMRHKEAHWVWVLDRGKVSSRTADGKPLLMFGTHEDISARKKTEQALLFDTQHDLLTRLPNRALLLDRLQRGLLSAKRNGARLAILFIDLDRFKQINDSLGHDAGDEVLIEVASRIKACLRESDTVARLGGDEFVVLLPVIDSEQDCLRVAEKIRQRVALEIALLGGPVQISTSIGIALFPEHGKDAEILLKNADIAMYYAKNSGRNNVRIFDESQTSLSGK